jgi:hypothetical protein
MQMCSSRNNLTSQGVALKSDMTNGYPSELGVRRARSYLSPCDPQSWNRLKVLWTPILEGLLRRNFYSPDGQNVYPNAYSVWLALVDFPIFFFHDSCHFRTMRIPKKGLKVFRRLRRSLRKALILLAPLVLFPLPNFLCRDTLWETLLLATLIPKWFLI